MLSNILKNCFLGGSVLLAATGCAGGGSTQDGEAGSPGAAGAFTAGGGFAEGGSGPSAGTGSGARAGATGKGGSDSAAGGGAGPAEGGSGPTAAGRGGVAGSGTSGGGKPGLGGAGPQFVGNITTGFSNGMDQGTRKFASYWDQVTPENAGKWGSVQSSAGAAFNWTALDAIYDYAEKNQILFKQHTFIWGSQQPSGTIDQAAVQKWMTEFCKRYPNTKLIDVVNEPPPHTTPAYAANIGGGTDGDWQWIANAFTWARAACPNAILILNDYNNIEWPNDSSHFIDIVKKVQALGAPIDAIGAQAHDLDHSGVSLATVTKLLGSLNSQTGLPVYITEMDIDTTDDARQLSLYQQYFPLFTSTSYVKGITIWGWIYGQTWSSAPNSGLIKSGTPRPAMTYLMDQLGRPAP
ncbi:MAG TPA: endo-1,4-beta-xylanase [Polyangiaceae bacterium]|nr:endo-1,4-beta-xylanase [Polyangiaceae bacterium]